jgi:hypothetical protein
MPYLSIANSTLLYVLAGIVIVFVLTQSVLFLRKAWKRGVAMGMDVKKLKDTVRASATLSIVPSIPILLGLIAMAPVLGIPFPWIRLSIVGSFQYELMAAGMGAEAMGLSGLGDTGFNAAVFANAMWVMTIGIIWGLVFCVFFLKSYQRRLNNVRKRDAAWGEILIMALFFGVIASFVGPYLIKFGVEILTLLSAAVIMLLMGLIIRKTGAKWLSNFALSLSMIAGMALAVLYTHLLGGM